MEKTISHLNGKMWYRLVKVIYIFSFLGAFVIFTFFSYFFLSSQDFSNSYVQCNDKRTITRGDLIESGIDVYYSINSDDENKVRAICAHPSYKLIENREGGKYSDTELAYLRNKYGVTTADGTSYELEPNYSFTVPNNVNPENVAITLAIFIGIIAFFEIVKRVFYYVVLGSIKPKK